MNKVSLSNQDIDELFNDLNKELATKSVIGQIYLVGGAVMCLVFKARLATRDLDAVFEPSDVIRKAVAKIAKDRDLPRDWLNDGVKGFLSADASYANYLELSNLSVYTATPEYLLAMKSLAMRIGEEFQDLNDIRYLLRYLNIQNYKQALEIITKYYPIERIPQKTLYALEEILEENN